VSGLVLLTGIKQVSRDEGCRKTAALDKSHCLSIEQLEKRAVLVSNLKKPTVSIPYGVDGDLGMLRHRS